MQVLHTLSLPKYVGVTIPLFSFAEQFELGKLKKKKCCKAKIFLFSFSQIAGEKKVEQIIIDIARNIPDGWQS